MSRAVGSDDVLNGVRKMLNMAQTREDGRRLLSHFAPLWVLSAGRPRTALRDLGAEGATEWPRGFHRVLSPLPVCVVVIPELLRGEETRWLRLLGKRDDMYRALAEVQAVRHDSEEARAVAPVVLRFRRELARRSEQLSADEEEFLMRTETAEWFEKFTEETREAGLRDGLEEVLRDQLVQRFGKLSPRVRRKLGRASAGDLQAWARRVLTAESVEDVFAG